MEFWWKLPIRFGELDPAGIVYYPNFFHYFHVAFEEFFGGTHGTPYSDWTQKRRIGFPTVHTEASFEKPVAYGDDVGIAVTIPRLSRRSVDFAFELRTPNGERRATALNTKVCVDMDDWRSREIPSELIPVFEQYSGS